MKQCLLSAKIKSNDFLNMLCVSFHFFRKISPFECYVYTTLTSYTLSVRSMEFDLRMCGQWKFVFGLLSIMMQMQAERIVFTIILRASSMAIFAISFCVSIFLACGLFSSGFGKGPTLAWLPLLVKLFQILKFEKSSSQTLKMGLLA